MTPLTGVLAESWEAYRRFAAHFLVISFVIYLVTGVIVAALAAYAGLGGDVAAAVIEFVAAALVQSALVTAVQDIRDGRVDLDFTRTVAAAMPFVPRVVAASLLAGLGVAAGLALLIVPGLVLLTFWSLIVPWIVIGGSGPLACFRLSWRTVRGYAWSVFGVYVLLFLLWVAFGMVVSLVVFVLPLAADNFISTLVAGTLFAPYLALVVTFVYYRLTAVHGQPAEGLGGDAPSPT